MKNFKQGSAVVIALLLMGTLTLLGVTLATLINGETRQIAETIRNGRASYLSEGGTELGLFFVHQTPPGSQPDKNNLDETYNIQQRANSQNIILGLASGQEAGLQNNQTDQIAINIQNRSNFLPILEEFQLSEGLQNPNNPTIRRDLFQSLGLNETVTIPLTDSQNFEVEYYFALDSSGFRQDWDILLWKLFGTNKDTGKLENLSEYFPATASKAQGSKDETNRVIGSTSTAPARFGSLTPERGFNCGTFFSPDKQSVTRTTENSNDEFKICDTLIQDFLRTHNNNYLVLTNGVNTAVFGENPDLFELANINWRICTPSCHDSVVNKNFQEQTNQNLVPKFTKVTSKGIHNQNTKFLYTSINPDGFLPVFDFSIYRTKN